MGTKLKILEYTLIDCDTDLIYGPYACFEEARDAPNNLSDGRSSIATAALSIGAGNRRPAARPARRLHNMAKRSQLAPMSFRR